ncbi:MAG TPA: hypothetical protein VM076_09810 [Gemmatimonadaceae bacterium]|nr:hypothetical protein [Gemmatimonadaceae bacterium]
MHRFVLTASPALVALSLALTACSDSATGLKPFSGPPLSVIGQGEMTARYMAEVWTQGNVAYTTTWGSRSNAGVSVAGNAVHIWKIDGAAPVLVDSLIVENATTLGDIQVSDDGKLLVVATERANGSIVLYSLTNPLKPTRITRYQTANTTNGVHTAEVSRVNGTLYAFLSIDTPSARLVIVDLTDPANPREVFTRIMGAPFVHDVYVRDGLLFTALWNDGATIWDIGGGGKGGTPANPVQIGNVRTAAWAAAAGGSEAHNIWWFHDPTGGANAKRFMFVGEEAPGTGTGTLGGSNGDIHVVDIANMAAPREVAFYHVDGAGTHNFSVDEQRGILYAAYYNGGVRAIDIRGDLSTCTAEQKSADGRCDLKKMGRELAAGLQSNGNVYVWGVHFDGSYVYASDMFRGLWKLEAANR